MQDKSPSVDGVPLRVAASFNMAVKRTGEKLRFAPLSADRLPPR